MEGNAAPGTTFPILRILTIGRDSISFEDMNYKETE